MLALDEGYEGFGWRVFESGRSLGSELKASLAKSLLDYFNDPTVPTSGDELTFFMTKEIMNRLAPSLLVVNFWDIDIAHYGAYSLYLEAIQRTDRLVHELWQHVAVAAAVPRSHDADGRAGARTGRRRGRERIRQPPQRRRVVPARLARGRWAPACRRARARSVRFGRRTSRRRSRGILGFKMPECEGRAAGRTGVLNPVEAASTQLLLCNSTQDSSATRRRWRERTRSCSPDCRRRSTRSFSSSFRSGRRCSQPSGATSARCSTQLAALAEDPTCQQATAGITRIETEAGCDKIARGNPGRFQDEAQALLRKRELLPAWRREIDAFFQSVGPGAGSPALSAGRAAPARRPDLRQRHRGPDGEAVAVASKATGVRVPLNLEDARGPETFLRKLFGARRRPHRRAVFGVEAKLNAPIPLHAWVVESSGRAARAVQSPARSVTRSRA